MRVELGRTHIGVAIFKQTLNWLIKILEMPCYRYPRIYFQKQMSIMMNDAKVAKYNWVYQIKKIFFEPIGETSMWDNLNSALLLDQKQRLCEKYENYLYYEDIEKCKKSSSLIVFPEFDLQKGMQQYFKIKLLLKILQLISQVRLINNINCRIVCDSEIYRLGNSSFCYLCSKPNSFLYTIIDCLHFKEYRIRFKLPIKDNFDLDFFAILENPNNKLIRKFIAFTKHILCNNI